VATSLLASPLLDEPVGLALPRLVRGTHGPAP